MLHSNHFVKRHDPWNKGKLIGQKPPLKLQEIWSIRVRLQLAKSLRYLALFNLAIDSKLKSCDLVKLKVKDVANSANTLKRAVVLQQKTSQPVQFEITQQTRDSIGHTRLESTVRYLGIEVDDALEMAEQTEV